MPRRRERELEAIAAMDPAALDKELADAGYDAARTKQRIAAARKAAYEAPVGKLLRPLHGRTMS